MNSPAMSAVLEQPLTDSQALALARLIGGRERGLSVHLSPAEVSATLELLDTYASAAVGAAEALRRRSDGQG